MDLSASLIADLTWVDFCLCSLGFRFLGVRWGRQQWGEPKGILRACITQKQRLLLRPYGVGRFGLCLLV